LLEEEDEEEEGEEEEEDDDADADEEDDDKEQGKKNNRDNRDPKQQWSPRQLKLIFNCICPLCKQQLSRHGLQYHIDNKVCEKRSDVIKSTSNSVNIMEEDNGAVDAIKKSDNSGKGRQPKSSSQNSWGGHVCSRCDASFKSLDRLKFHIKHQICQDGVVDNRSSSSSSSSNDSSNSSSSSSSGNIGCGSGTDTGTYRLIVKRIYAMANREVDCTDEDVLETLLDLGWDIEVR
jgi:hypothetical protein